MPKIEVVRQSRLLRISRVETTGRQVLRFENAPPTCVSGYYWLYTNYSLEELEASTPSPADRAINLPLLATLHRDLSNVCTLTQDGFRLVYNGIAGDALGIRGRLGQHFNGGNGTGALHICRSSLSDLSRWRYSYATINTKGAVAADVQSSYSHAESVERIWRLEHGWPLFCSS